MACKQLVDELGNVVGFACGSAWGVGIYETGDEDYPSMYGFAPTNLDPHDWSPDYECCTSEEIAAWEKAKSECKVHVNV